MFPLRGRLDAASKSNSSTLDPSRTTTRVSSGWMASISIRLVMEISGARAAGSTQCGGVAARIDGGKQVRGPIRRNGQGLELVQGRKEWERKSGRHGHFGANWPRVLPERPL